MTAGFDAGYAHCQRRTPLWCWGNMNTHVSGTMRAFTQAHPDWLTVVRLRTNCHNQSRLPFGP